MAVKETIPVTVETPNPQIYIPDTESKGVDFGKEIHSCHC